MKMPPDRTIFTVTRVEGVWRVEHEGEPFGHSREKAVAEAAARRRAREVHGSGRLCQVRVLGDSSWANV